jgi:HEAT repeat protein
MKPLAPRCLSLGGLMVLVAIAAAQEPAAPKHPAVARWLDALRSPDRRTQLEAAYSPPDPGTAPEAWTAAVVAALADTNPLVRRSAAGALGEQAREPRQVVPALLRALSDPDPNVCQHAALALIKIGGPAVPELVGAVRRSAAEDGRPDPAADYVAFALKEIGGPAAGALVGLLRHKYERRPHEAAAGVLAAMGRPAIPELTRALGDPSRKVRRLVVTALAQIGADDPKAVAALARVFQGDDEELAEAAGRALVQAGSPGLQMLVAAIQGNDPDQRLLSLESLLTVRAFDREAARKALPAVALALADPTDTVRRRAATCAARLVGPAGPDAKVVGPALARTLGDAQAGVRLEAARALDALARAAPSEAQPGVAALTRALADADVRVQVQAAQALGEARAAAGALPPLTALLRRHADPQARAAAALALGKIGVAEDEVVDSLAQALRTDGNSAVRQAAAAGLGGLGKNPRAAEALVRALPAARPVGPAASAALAAMGADALPALEQAIQSPQKAVRPGVLSALERMARTPPPSPTRLVAVLRVGLKDDDKFSRERAANALGAIGPAAEPAVSDLVAELAATEDPAVRRAAAWALGRIGPKASAAVPTLKELAVYGMATERPTAARALAAIDLDSALPLLQEWLAQQDPWPRSAVETLGSLGPRALPALRDALGHRSPGVRRAAASAVGALGAHGKGAVPELAKMLRDPDASARAGAARALGQIGSAARAATLALVPALKDENSGVRQNVAQALGLIGADGKEAGPPLAGALSDPDAEVRTAAARSLIRLDVDLKPARRLLTAVATERFLKSYFARVHSGRPSRPSGEAAKVWGLAKNLQKLQGSRPDNAADVPTSLDYDESSAFVAGGGSGAMEMYSAPAAPLGGSPPGAGPVVLPPFPWPPWHCYDRRRLVRQALGDDRTQLRKVHQYLLRALERAGFRENRLFQVGLYPENGFVLLTRLERVHEDGTPFPNKRRWGGGAEPGLGSFSLVEQLGSLYRDSAGHYRMIAFAVTRDVEVPSSGTAPRVGEIEALFPQGLRDVTVLPDPVGGIEFAGFHAHVLIYQFERTTAEGSRLVAPGEGPPETPRTAEGHLKAAGVQVAVAN